LPRWLFDGSLRALLLTGIVLRLFKKLMKRGVFSPFLVIFTLFSRKERASIGPRLFCARHLLWLVVNQQRLGAVGDGVFVNDNLGNILLVGQLKHDIQQ